MHSIFRALEEQLSKQHRRHLASVVRTLRHPFTIPAALFTSLLCLTIVGLIIFAFLGHTLNSQGNNIVIISHDHQIQTVPSSEPTVGALLAKLQLKINQGDVVEPSPDTPIHQDDFRINIYRAAPVKVTDGMNSVVSSSAATTPRSIAVQAGLIVYPEDQLSIAPVHSFMAEGALGSVVTINRSIPVTLDINGFQSLTRTRAKNVSAFLNEKDISLGKTGSVQPASTAILTASAIVHVTRDGTGIQSVSEGIPMPVQNINDDSLAYGTSAVRQQGSNGNQVLTYRVEVKNGVVVTKTLIQTVVTVEAVTQIVVQGTNLSGIKGDMALAGIASDQYTYADYIISHESGWCPTKWQGQYGACPAYHGAPTSAGIGYGLCQATPGYKMVSAGNDWATNPITQLKWCSGYANGRYGSWYNAYIYWMNHHNW
jgi:uncharacterized protein YabE (DUF348 family)